MPLDISGLQSSPSSISLFTTAQKKYNINADALSRIPWDQNIEADTVGVIFKAAADGPDKAYPCHEGAISSLILESSPTPMTVMEWVWTQKTEPTISQVTTWIEVGKVGTVKVTKEMSQDVSNI